MTRVCAAALDIARRFGMPADVTKRVVLAGYDVLFVTLRDDGAGVVLEVSDQKPEVQP